VPWSSMSEVPKRLRKAHGARLTLGQINKIARQADAIERTGVPKSRAWAIARGKFKKSHQVSGKKWTVAAEAFDEEKQTELDFL